MARHWLTLLLAFGAPTLAGCGRALLEIDGCMSSDCLGTTGDGGMRTPLVVSDAGAGGGTGGGAPAACTAGQTSTCPTSCGSRGTRTCLDGSWGACVTPATESRCNDGLDDDCDGRVDHSDPECPPVEVRCEDTEGHGCNGDLGYGDRCAPADNTGGCSVGRFQAWCNRRNPAYPDLWDGWIHDWVSTRCDGSTTLDGATFTCTSSDNRKYSCTTPLVLAFHDERVRYAPATGFDARFDLVPGREARHDWPTPVTPWLAVDRDGDGRVGDGSELLGSSTVLADGSRAVNGFEALVELDDSGDGLVTRADASWRRLLVWRDANADRVSAPDELTTADAAGLEALEVASTTRLACDVRGNCEKERSRFWYRTSTGLARGSVIDVYLRTEVRERQLACR